MGGFRIHRPEPQNLSLGPIILHWTISQLSSGARNLYMGIPTYESAFAFSSVTLPYAQWRLPFPMTLQGWSIYQSTVAAGYVNGITFTLRHLNDTASLDSFTHTPGTTVDRALAVNTLAGDTYCIRSNDPGQGSTPLVGIRALLWGVRTA